MFIQNNCYEVVTAGKNKWCVAELPITEADCERVAAADHPFLLI